MKRLFAFLLSFVVSFCQLHAQDIDSLITSLNTDKQKADTLYYFSMQNFRKNSLDNTISLLNRGFEFAKKTGNNELMGKYVILHSNALLLKEEYTEGLAVVKQAYPYVTKASSYNLQEKYLFLNGMFFERMIKNDSAIFYYHLVEALNNRENPYRNWLLYIQMGRMFQFADAFDQAEEYFKKAYDITKEKKVRMDYGLVLNRFVELYYDWEKTGKFAAMMEEQQKFIESGKKDYTKDPVHSMVYIDWNKKKFSEKIAFMENVKKEFIKQRSSMQTTVANDYIAGFYEEEKRFPEALKITRENQQTHRQQNNIIDLYINTKIAYRLLKKMGRKDEALAESDELIILKDSIIRIQQRAIVLDLDAKYETEKKEKDIALLNTEKRLNEIQLAREREIRVQLIAGATLLLLCGLTIFFLYRKQRSKNRLIQKQADELEVLMREIHHRVKNNLQVISSLLDLQSLTIGDRQASEAIKESRNRVYSMALIHQNLYKEENEENIMSIEMTDYINKLTQNLFQSYNIGENKVLLEIDIDHILLDVDMVIPIGLVLNELISNALKYAFSDIGPGVLQIAFKKTQDEILLKVKDNGKGFPAGLNIFQTQSFGYKLVKAFAQKLKARLEVYNDNGACVLLHIRKFKTG